MTKYRWNKQTGAWDELTPTSIRDVPKRLQVMKSMPSHRSILTGRTLHSRTDRNAELKDLGYIDARDAPSAEQCEKIQERARSEAVKATIESAMKELETTYG